VHEAGKTAIAALLLGVGIISAVTFRRPENVPPPATLPVEADATSAPSGEGGASEPAGPRSHLVGRIDLLDAADAPHVDGASSVAAHDASETSEPPAMSSRFLDAGLSFSPWDGTGPVGPTDRAPRPVVSAQEDKQPTTHTIRDGDTLDGIAEQYFGDRDRVRELYEANRDVLHGPDLLPIGVELRIPSLEELSSEPANAVHEPPPMVAIPRGALQRGPSDKP